MDPTVEIDRDATKKDEDSPRTRVDLPVRRADPTCEDLPRRARPESPAEPLVPYDEDPGRPRPRTPWRWVKRAFYLVIALIIGVPLAAGAYVWYVAREDVRTHSDAILVLGAAQFNGTPGDVLAWRLRHALNLYKAGVSKHIVTVGGKRPGDNYTEAGSGKAWLAEHGVPSSQVVAVPAGSDTLQSMIAAGGEFKKLGWHTATIVTDPPHALRSRTMARANGINAATSPTRSGPTVYSRDTQFHYIVRETGGYLYFQLYGRWRDEP
ncbi:YdcF family protein [Actinomadura sp. DC4]|uniref:YdcF family protein n=1 Tax=Actinomadura sp. DC4 TaxID=3055069 RepID=UPI0025AF6F2C|nr:YdcF family protein [Actinomadura sp. DC4]MDN3353417.1 YdcF family protein [Actinomadura sp. DC4]